MLKNPNWKPETEVPIKRKNLTPEEIKYLLRVRESLLDGTISPRRFKMDTVKSSLSCGTVGCLGGWMGMFHMMDDGLSKKEIAGVHDHFDCCFNGAPIDENWKKYFGFMDDPKFKHLFFPEESNFDFGEHKATPAMGVRAIDRFLAGEVHPWAD